MPTSLGSNIATATPTSAAPPGEAALTAPISFVDGCFVPGTALGVAVNEYHILADAGQSVHTKAVRADDPRLLPAGAFTGTVPAGANLHVAGGVIVGYDFNGSTTGT